MNEDRVLAEFMRSCAGMTSLQLAQAVVAHLKNLPPERLQALWAGATQPLPPRAEPSEPRGGSVHLPPGWRPHYGGPCPVEDACRVRIWTRGFGDMGIEARASFWRRGGDAWRWQCAPEEEIVGFKPGAPRAKKGE